jgi:hypothetical protein
MHSTTVRRASRPLAGLRLTQEFLQEPSWWFDQLLNQELFSQCFVQAQHQVPGYRTAPTTAAASRNREYPPLVTLWLFMLQSLNADPSCQRAVQNWIAHLSQQGKKIVSSATGGYCRARKRLSLRFIQLLTQGLGARLEEQAGAYRWKGLQVQIADGTVLYLADTLANGHAYPKRSDQKRGLPQLRVLAIFSLATGALIHLRSAPVCGTGTKEDALLRKLLHSLPQHTLLLLDRIFNAFIDLAALSRARVDFIVPQNRSRSGSESLVSDFRRGQRLGKHDHLITLERPQGAPQWLPSQILVREIRVNLQTKGFRAKKIHLLTSLTDPKKYRRVEIEQLYAERWNIEVDFRTLKVTLNLNVLRCKTPQMLQKELWTALFGYNVVRLVQLDAAHYRSLQVRQLSFAQTLQGLLAFEHLIWFPHPNKRMSRAQWYHHYLDLIESIKKVVKNRPGRIEPRLVKHRPRKFALLKQPRATAKFGYWKKGSDAKIRRKMMAAVLP